MIDTNRSYQAQTRHTHTGMLVAIGGMGAVIIFGLIIAAAIFRGINKVKEEGPTTARFYLALQDHNYALAYSFLDSEAKLNNQAVDQQTFIKQAAQADALSTTIKGFDYSDKGNNASATVNVHRGNFNYQTHLTLKQVENRWVITNIDRL
jgi:hypothetical protein